MPEAAAGIYRATVPGRVNLIGEWIDFNGGLVLPMPLPVAIDLQRQANNLGQDRIISEQFEEVGDFGLEDPAAGHWSDYVRGALQYARAKGWISGGQTVSIASSIPVGAGLSSSAATIVATLKTAASDMQHVAPLTIALAAQAIENDYIGVPCGIMDQVAVAAGEPGAALALDTRTRQYQSHNIPDNWRFLVLHSGVSRALSDGRYKTRREECMAAADNLGVDYLCDARLDDISGLDASLAHRARHVITEADRSRQAVDALIASDFALFGQLMTDSHLSLQADMQVSVPRIDEIVRDALALGAAGARITGAGFGGCFVALVESKQAARWADAMVRRHPDVKLIA
ncbi:MAG: galactokinase [Henriciella sp.]